MNRDSVEAQYRQEVVARYGVWQDAYVPLPARLLEEHVLGAWPADRLSLNSPRFDPRVLSRCWAAGQVISEPRDISNVIELGSQPSDFVIHGEPGAGKSVALMRLALQQTLPASDGSPSSRLPILVNLGGYRPLSAPDKFLVQHLAELGRDGFPAHGQLALGLRERLESGQLLILLDGLDELPTRFLNWSLRRWRDFLARYGSDGRGNRIIVSTRHPELAYTTGLPVVSLCPLPDESKSLLLDQYLNAQDSGNFWAQLHEPDYQHILALTGSPFWLVRIAQLYAARKSVPRTRSRILGEWLELAQVHSRSGSRLDNSPPKPVAAGHAWFQAYRAAAEVNQSGGLTRGRSALWRMWAPPVSLRSGRLLRHNAFRPLPDLPSSARPEQALLLLEMSAQPAEALRALIRLNPLLAAECALESDPGLIQDVGPEVVQALMEWINDEKRDLRSRILAGNLLGQMGDPRLLETVFIPAGEVVMGSGRSAHVMSVPAFRLFKYPVTRRDFHQFVSSGAYQQREWWTRAGWKWLQATGRTESHVPHDPPNYPVVGVTWYEAVAYGNWLSSQHGVLYRLPTEAEWQRAARGQTEFLYPWGDQADPSRANTCTFDSLYVFGVTPVGIYPKGTGQFGAYDQAGNVWEWCSSQYLPYPYDPSDGREILQSDDARVLRGGSWLHPLERARCAVRSAEMPDAVRPDVGFRLLQVPNE